MSSLTVPIHVCFRLIKIMLLKKSNLPSVSYTNIPQTCFRHYMLSPRYLQFLQNSFTDDIVTLRQGTFEISTVEFTFWFTSPQHAIQELMCPVPFEPSIDRLARAGWCPNRTLHCINHLRLHFRVLLESIVHRTKTWGRVCITFLFWGISWVLNGLMWSP